MRADPLRGEVGGGWALDIENFLGPVKWHRADGQAIWEPKISRFHRAQPPPTCPSNGSARIKNRYIQGCINHSCIGSFMYKSPRVTLTGSKGISNILGRFQGPYHPSSAVK
jgi:hypothetical protein